ncbi:unnamed protein product [Rhodiola kirilowii]
MSMVRELKYFLGLQVAQGEDGTRIHQQKYVKEILKKFGMESAKTCATPMSPNDTLTKDESSPRVDPTLYRGMIGSLLYLTASRSDILFRVCLCARFQVDPRETHVKAVNRLLRYLKGTDDLSLFYPRGGELRQKHTLTQTMLGARQTGSPHQGWLNILDLVSSLGLQRNSPQLRYPPLRRNTSPVLLPVRSCCGSDNS